MHEFAVEISYIDKVKHVTSTMSTNDEELAFAHTITETVQLIEIQSEAHSATVRLETEAAVYHFVTFRTDYLGHASRTLLALLARCGVILSVDFLLDHPTMTIYLEGEKIVAGREEFPIAWRETGYERIENVTLALTSRTVDQLMTLSDVYGKNPIAVLEEAIAYAHETLLTTQEEPSETDQEMPGVNLEIEVLQASDETP
ncbi:MAG: hypothetical protein ACYCYO_00105 [Bacilli bacterium]